MPSWNELGLKIFNDSCVVGSIATRRYDDVRIVARGSEARRRMSARRYWSVDLSGLLIAGHQLQEIRDFELVTQEAQDPCLMRISTYDRLEDFENQPSFLGTGIGSEIVLQLVKRSYYQGAYYIDNIEYPWYDYYPLKDLNGEDWTPLPELQIWQGAPVWNGWEFVGTDITSSCDINRNGGQTTTDATGDIYATGGFLWKMLCLTGIKVKPMGPVYEVQDGVQFVEPKPDAGEVAG